MIEVDDASSLSAPASVTSRSTSVMAVASVSCRCRATAFVSEAVLSSASGRDMPAVASASSDIPVGGGASSVAPASSRTVFSTARSLASSSRSSSVKGSPGASKSCTPRLTVRPSVTHSQIQSTNSTRLSGGMGATSGRTITSAAGKPNADPSAPTTSTRLSHNPATTKPTKHAIRSQAISRATIHASSAAPRPSVTPATARMEPSSVAAVSSWVMRYITIITMSACGMRWVRIGMVAITQASVSRKVALPRPGVGASSRRRKPTSPVAVTGSRSSASLARSPPPRPRCGRIRRGPRP